VIEAVEIVSELGEYEQYLQQLSDALGQTDEGRYVAGDMLVDLYQVVKKQGELNGATERAVSRQWNTLLRTMAKEMQRSHEALKHYFMVARDIPKEERRLGDTWRPFSLLRLALGKDSQTRDWIYDEASYRSIEDIRGEMSDRVKRDENPDAVTITEITEVILHCILDEQHKPYEKYYEDLYRGRAHKIALAVKPYFRRMFHGNNGGVEPAEDV